MTTIENKELEESWVKQDWVYIKTALILAFFTAIEVFTYFESVHKAPEWLLVTTLSFLMVVSLTRKQRIWTLDSQKHNASSQVLLVSYSIKNVHLRLCER